MGNNFKPSYHCSLIQRNLMKNQKNSLYDLSDILFGMSELVLSSNNDSERDRWGATLGIEIFALRINDYAIIFSYIEVDEDEEGDTLCELEECCKIDSLFERAKIHHDAYYDYLDVVYAKDNPKKLKNQCSKLCKLLDTYYEPEENLIATYPSEVLKIITKKSVHESGREWAWFNQTLFLTQYKIQRSLYNSHHIFDVSLSEIFNCLKYKVEKVTLIGNVNDLSIIENIKESVHIEKIRNLEKELNLKTSELLSLEKKVSEIESLITDLTLNLNRLKSNDIYKEK